MGFWRQDETTCAIKIRKSLSQLYIKATELDTNAAWANEKLQRGVPWWNIVERIRLVLTIFKVNKRYKFLERMFLYEGGLDGRSWFKHVVFAPGLWTGYAGAVYPGLMESIDAKDFTNGLKWAGIVNGVVNRAIESIE